MTDQQTVVDTTKTAAQPAVADPTSARDDVDPLDQLLAEYDRGTKQPDAITTQPEPKDTPPADALAGKVRMLEMKAQQWENEQSSRAISETVRDIRGDVSPELIDDEMISAWIDAQARKDPRLVTAFQQREQNPKQWAKVKTELGKSLAKKVGSIPDRQATDDRAAVAAAVRGASTPVIKEPPPNLGQMSDAELREYTRKNFGF